MLVRQLEEELRIRTMQNHHPSHEVRQQVETMYAENDHLSREVAILRETVKVCLGANAQTMLTSASYNLFMAVTNSLNFYFHIGKSHSFHVCFVSVFLFFSVCVCVLRVYRKQQQQQQQQELELRIETQKQTLQSRDESIKKLLEMLQNKGMGEFNCTLLFFRS